MEKFLTKKNVLGSSSTYILLVVVIFIIAKWCRDTASCVIREDEFPGSLLFVFFPLFLVFFFSLLTYRMHDEVFRHWMNFTTWAVPILIILTYVIASENNGGLGIASAYGDSFDTLLFFLLYGVFVGVSIYRIVSKYRERKRQERG